MTLVILTPEQMVAKYDGLVEDLQAIKARRDEIRFGKLPPEKSRAFINAFTLADMAEQQLVEIRPIVLIYAGPPPADESISGLLMAYAQRLIQHSPSGESALLNQLTALGFEESEISAYAAEVGSALLEASESLVKRTQECLERANKACAD